MSPVPTSDASSAVSPAEPVPAPPRAHWWQRVEVRAVLTTLVFVGLLLASVDLPRAWQQRWHLTSTIWFEVTPTTVYLVVGLLLMPFLRRVSYRKRDVLLIGLIPFWGQFLAAKIVYRLLALPRRDWPPRPDERPRAVPVPGSRGVYVQPPTFADAEELRSRWCVNPEHEHPYAIWAEAARSGCTRPGPATN